MFTGINESKHQQNIDHANVNVNLTEENVTQTNGGITINHDVSVKNIIFVKNILSGVLLHVVTKMVNFKQVLWMIQQFRVMKL